jgi:hypothetical protein
LVDPVKTLGAYGLFLDAATLKLAAMALHGC